MKTFREIRGLLSENITPTELPPAPQPHNNNIKDHMKHHIDMAAHHVKESMKHKALKHLSLKHSYVASQHHEATKGLNYINHNSNHTKQERDWVSKKSFTANKMSHHLYHNHNNEHDKEIHPY